MRLFLIQLTFLMAAGQSVRNCRLEPRRRRTPRAHVRKPSILRRSVAKISSETTREHALLDRRIDRAISLVREKAAEARITHAFRPWCH